MRLIDADKVLKLINDEQKSALAKHDFVSVRCYKNAFEIIDEYPTAYDVDAVVNQLELHSFEFESGTLPAHYVRLNDAIEIVRAGERKMKLCEFAKMLDGKEYGYPLFTESEIQIAKDNGFVIVSGASDDLVELEGAITDERGCFNGGKIHVKAVTDGGIMFGNCEISNVFSFGAKWCEDKDESGNVIPWTYDVPIEHATFMIYEDGKPYCRGFVFKVVDAES